MAKCVFCKIVNGEIPCERIYDDARVIALMDTAPANKGHILVLPKTHYETLLDIPDEDLGALIKITKRIAKGIMNALHADGFNVFINSREAAGQIIDHAHIHLLPRFKNDGIGFGYESKRYEENEMKEYANRIRKAIR